jgi:RNA polymerase sigma-70 factor (ECF subfamily)
MISAYKAKFMQIYDAHARPLQAFLASRVEPSTDGPEVAQEVWLRVWKTIGTFDGKNHRAWVFQIARHLLVDRIRRKCPEALRDPDSLPNSRAEEPDANALEIEQRLLFQRCLERLISEERELVRSRLAGEGFEEVCPRLGITAAQGHKLFHTAKARLRSCVEGTAE